MITYESLRDSLENENVSVFRILNLGEILNSGLLMSGLEEFCSLIKSGNIKRVYVYEHYEEASDYCINEELISKESRCFDKEFLELILPQINEYNTAILKMDFNYPSWVLAICFCDNNAFFINYENDRTLDSEPLIEPKEKFELICSLNEEKRKSIREKSKSIIDALYIELEDKILSDEEFKLCTNKELRRNYAYKTFAKLDKHFAPLKKYLYNEDCYLLSSEGRNFIEVLWRKLK